MENIEKKCRELAKEKDIKIMKKINGIWVYYKIWAGHSKQSRRFENWEEVLIFVEKFE